MASDLGAWPAEQASVLLEVLQRDGLTPEAKRTRDGIHVFVPDAQSDQAHQVLAANMDVIANAARPGGQGGGRQRSRRPQARAERPSSRRERSDESGGRLTSERMLRIGPPIMVFLAVLLVANLLPPSWTLPVVVVGAFAGIWLLGKRAQNDE